MVIVAVAVVVWAFVPRDKFDGNSPTDDTQWQISCDITIGDFDNQWGQVEARDVDFDIASSEYESGDGWFPGLTVREALFGFLADEFDFVCMVRCTGPNGFEAEAQDVQKMQVDEWDWGHRTITFHTLRFYLEEPGRYTLNLEIVVDAEDEGLDHETVATDTKSISVG